MQTKPTNHYIGYARVSSYESAERNLSIPSQIEQIQNYASQHNFCLVKIYREEHSAFKGVRPAFAEMLKDIKHNKTRSGIIIFKYDRISRNLEDFLKLENLLKDHNMNMVSVTEPMFNNYLGKYMVRDMQNRAILYSEELSFRVKLGFRKKMQMGGYIGGHAPYGLKVINGYIVPDESKANIILYIFETYATGQYGFGELANLVRKKFNVKFTHRRIYFVIKNSMYCGYKTKIWKLNNSEYVFWGYDKPGEYTEVYQMKFVTPLITKDLFDKCQLIKEEKKVYKGVRTGKASFPKIFQCICGRNMKRDDKKGHRYLGCTKQINNVFPVKCTQSYVNFNTLELQLKKIFPKILLTSRIRQAIIKETESRMSANEGERNDELLVKLHEYEQTKNRVAEITHSYTIGKLDQDLFELTLKGVNEKIANLKSTILSLQNQKHSVEIGHKVIKFMNILETYDTTLNLDGKNKKSSQCFPVLFKAVANLILDHGNIRSYQLFKPFDIIEKCANSDHRGLPKNLQTPQTLSHISKTY